jgi:hypothetical protein
MRIRTGAILLAFCAFLSPVFAATPKVAVIASWRELQCPRNVVPGTGALYYSFPLENGTKAHLVVVDMKTRNWRIRPAMSDQTAPTSQIAASQSASAAINGGYFNLSDGVSASYVVSNSAEVADPKHNKALVENPKLQPHLQSIFNRAEIRFLTNKANGAASIEIVKHDAPVSANCTLRDSLQAGPLLVPTLDSEKEAFLRTEPDGSITDSIGSKRLAARTAFGITNDNYAIMLTAAGKAQEDGSSGLTLTQLADLMKRLGCVQAINLDGGSSTTMYVKAAPAGQASTSPPAGEVVCGKSPETRVKSILMLEPAKK